MTRPGRLEWWQEPPDGIDEAKQDYFDRMAELRAERDRLRAANEKEARDGTR